MTKENLTLEQIDVACNWWADALCNPKFDNGDSSMAGMITQNLAQNCVKPVSEESRNLFIEKFSELLSSKYSCDVYIAVDYHPRCQLAAAMKYAGISVHNAPCKTAMSFDGGGVTVWYGYGQPAETLLTKKDDDKPIEAELPKG